MAEPLLCPMCRSCRHTVDTQEVTGSNSGDTLRTATKGKHVLLRTDHNEKGPDISMGFPREAKDTAGPVDPVPEIHGTH